MTITVESLYNSIEQIKRSLNGVSERVTELEKMSGVYVTQSILQSATVDLQTSVDDMNKSITDIETRLQKITLPTDTRYYLEESEITDFRNHFRQLRSMMAELEKSRQAFIRLAARYNLTNSAL